MLWIVGDSIAHGIGINPDQRYGILLAELTGLPVKFITHPGSSMQWASAELCQADLQNNDTVVWLFTLPDRFYSDGQHLGVWNCNEVEFFDSEELKNININAITNAIQYCQNKNARLLMFEHWKQWWDFKSPWDFLDPVIKVQINDITEVRIGARQFIDRGTDGEHPGPQTHKIMSELMYKVLIKE
jgi:hypothetical protein